MSRRMPWLLAAVLTVACLSVLPLGAERAQADDPINVNWPALLPTLVDEYDPTSDNDCVAGRSNCLKQTLDEMSRQFQPLATSCSHNAPFALAYLRITQDYGYVRAQSGYFQDVRWMNHVDAVFAKYYLTARANWVRGGSYRSSVPRAWAIAFDAADNRKASGSGNLLLGINAHVNRDLPFVMAASGLLAPDGTPHKPDFDQVNDFLLRMVAPMTAELTQRFDPSMASTPTPLGLADTLSYQVLAAWRETAWRNAERLATAPTDAERAQVAAEIESSSATEAQTLLSSMAYVPPITNSASRDAYCAVHYADPPPQAYDFGTPGPY